MSVNSSQSSEISANDLNNKIALLMGIIFITAGGLDVIPAGFSKISMVETTAEQVAACKENLNKIGQAITVYKKIKKVYPQRLSDICEDKRSPLKEIPQCPACKKPSYVQESYMFREGNPGRFTVFCKGNHHVDAGYYANQPYLDSLYGSAGPHAAGISGFESDHDPLPDDPKFLK